MMANINTNISFLLEDIEDTEDNLNYTEDKLYSLIDDTSNIKNNLIKNGIKIWLIFFKIYNIHLITILIQ